MELYLGAVVWRSATTTYGELSVMTVSAQTLLKLLVGSWDMAQQVSRYYDDRIVYTTKPLSMQGNSEVHVYELSTTAKLNEPYT